MHFEAVLLDWRGTLACMPTPEEWAGRALSLLGRDADDAPGVVALLDAVPAIERLWAPGLDANAQKHRLAYLEVFRDAGLDDDLAVAMYEVESDVTQTMFADDAVPVMRQLAEAGLKIAIISDIHVDLRPAFAAAGAEHLVDAFVLSFEVGVQKPDQGIFALALTALSVQPQHALMVGDRAAYDAGGLALGITTLLLPPLRSVKDCRLHRVLSAVGRGAMPEVPARRVEQQHRALQALKERLVAEHELREDVG